jgi:hypothetical protein
MCKEKGIQGGFRLAKERNFLKDSLWQGESFPRMPVANEKVILKSSSPSIKIKVLGLADSGL